MSYIVLVSALVLGRIHQSNCSTCGNMVYSTESYSELAYFDFTRSLSSYSVCLAQCAINQSCAAVSYNKSTSTCAMSGVPGVVDYPGDCERLTLVKQSQSDDLKVYQFSSMIARSADVLMSSRLSSYYGSNTVDGIYIPDKDLASMAHTLSERSPWIQVNLPTNHYIIGVKIWNRSKGAQVAKDRLKNVRVTVSESHAGSDPPPDNEICNYLAGKPQVDPLMVTCHTRMHGRYVRLTAVDANNALNIYEMEVHGLTEVSKA